MTDDRFDELLREAARDYHRPGEVPRERMWERVQAARAMPGEAPRHTRPLAAWAWTGLAAAALLTIGIAVGRWMERSTYTRPVVAAARPAPDTASRVAASRPPADGEPSRGRAADAEGSTGTAARVPDAKRFAAGARPTRGTSPATGAGAEPSPDAGSPAYRVELAEHFASTEALLTSFREASRSGHAPDDRQLATWARDLLTTTRMLQASAPSDDPTMKRLLDDLELVLMQIAEYTAGDRHRAEDARLIEQAIERHAVMTRLRTNPAGLTSPGT